MFTHSLLGPVHARLPDQCVVAELHLVGVHHVPAVCEEDIITHHTYTQKSLQIRHILRGISL